MQESLLARWLRYLVYTSALIPLVIFAQYISPFHFGKVVLLRSIVEVMAALYLLLIWRDRSYLPKAHIITWAFLAFTLAYTLTTITSVSPLQSWWGTLERMGGLFTFWHYFIFYIITISVLRSKRDWQTLLDLMVSVGLVSAVYGFLQRLDLSFILGSGGRERIFGTIGNPALFAGYQILVGYLAATIYMARRAGAQVDLPSRAIERGITYIGVGLGGVIMLALLASPLEWLGGLWVVPLGLASYGAYLFLAESFGAAQIFYGVTAVATLLAAAMTVVRGSLVAMVVATILYALLYSAAFKSPRAKSILLGGIAAVIVFLFLGALLRNTPLVQNSPYLRRVTDFSLTTTTVQTRFWAWSAGFKGWSENPRTVLVGWGPENFNIPFSKYFNPKFFTGPGAETFFDRAHNMFVEVLTTMGLVGELAYLSIFVAVFIALARLMRRQGADRAIGIGFVALTVAYMIHNAFIFDTSANFLTFFMILAFIVHTDRAGQAVVVAKTAPAKAVAPARWSTAQRSAAVALGLVTTIGVYAYNFVPVQANFASTRAIVAGWQGDFAGAVNKYRQAIDYDTAGRYEIRHRFAQYLLEVSGSTDTKQIPNFKDVVLTAIEDVKTNVQESPQDYLPLLYLSRLYITLGKDDANSPYNQMALEYSTKALEISPTFVRTYYEIAQAYLNSKQYDKAFEWFKKASDLNPDVGVTYWYMGVVEYQRKHTVVALQYMNLAVQKGYGMSENDTLKLISIYVEQNNLPKVVELYEQLITQYPEKPQYLTSLAVGYARLGRMPEAIAAVRKAMALAPNDAEFQKDATEFLHQLGAQ